MSKDTLCDFLDVPERGEILRIVRTKSTNVRAIKYGYGRRIPLYLAGLLY